jgi:16S rRNA processing protein RimM
VQIEPLRKLHGKGLVVRFEGIADRNAAGNWADSMSARRATRYRKRPNEFYWADLIGLDVVNQSAAAGPCRRTGEAGHEVLDVRDEDGSQRLLPFVATVIKEVDLAGRRIRVDWERDW